MADKKYPGHDEGTKPPPSPPQGYNSPATHAPLTQESNSVNTKTPLGTGGKS